MITYSIIQKSQLEGALRMDAEYYQPKYLGTSANLNDLETKRLVDLCKVTDGNHVSISRCFSDSGVRYLRGKDLADFFLLSEDPIYIPDDIYNKLKRSHIFQGDVLISIVGTVGMVSIVADHFEKLTGNCKIAILHPKNVDPWFLSIFLMGEYGQFQIQRKIAGAVQTGIILKDLANILIPIFNSRVQKEVGDIVKSAYDQHNFSLSFYSQAENRLLEELGLNDFESPDDLSYVANLSDAQYARRVDAEYFQPKYERLLSIVKSQRPKRLEDFVRTYSTGFPFKSENYQEKGIPLIRINNIRKGYLDLSDTAYLSEKDYLLAPKDMSKPGDIILSMSGTIGISTIIPKDVTKSSINQRILRISTKDIDKDYLVLLLNSLVGAHQLERIGTGGVQTNISYKDIKNILIPVVPKPTQQKITDLIRRSHEARKKAKELLEEAKRKVEEMIEKGNRR